MASQLSAKIRLVKCPKCRRVLPELSNVPVYQCGGCNTVLEVKKRRNGAGNTGLYICESDANLKNEVKHDFEETETGEQVNSIIETDHKDANVTDCFSSGRESFEAALGEAEDGLDKFMFKKINGVDKKGEGREGLSSSDEVNSLTEFGHHDSEEFSPISQENHHYNKELSPVDESHGEVALKGNSLEKNKENNHISPSNKVGSHEIEDLSPETGTSREFDADAISRYIFGNFKKGKVSAVDDSVGTSPTLSRESTSTEDLAPPPIERLEQSQPREATEVEPVTFEETLENKEFSTNQNSCNQDLRLNELSHKELEDSSLMVVTPTKSRQNFLSRFVFGTLKKDKLKSPGGSANNSPRFSGESRLEKKPMAPHNEQTELSQLREHSRFESVSSEENLESITFTNADSARKSYHAYDGSESSSEETDNQDPDQYLRLLKGKSTEAEPSQVKDLPTGSYPDSLPREEKLYKNKGFVRRPVRSWTQFKNDDGLSRDHFRPRVFPAGYEDASSSNHVHNNCHYGKNANLPPKRGGNEEEKLKLKKMVLELQDQLNRSRIPKGYSSGGLNRAPPCYHVSSEMETCCDMSHVGYQNRYYQREALPTQCKFSHTPFSAEAAISRPQMGCLQCSPHDFHCFAPLSPCFYGKPNNCTARSDGHYYKGHCPCSDIAIKSREVMCTDDCKHREEKDYRVRKHVLRRHLLPVKGAAPFVVCDYCSVLLQLPADFLLFRKRCHHLKCSSCSYVSKFLLHNGSRLERYKENVSGNIAPTPPPSEVDDLRNVNKEKKTSYVGNCPHVDSMCISDDYGPSTCKSCSTEGEPLSVVVPYDIQKREWNRKDTISGGSVDQRNLRKKQSVFKESQNIYKDRISTAGKSSQATGKLRGRDVSPLYKLMDYNSAREVLNKR